MRYGIQIGVFLEHFQVSLDRVLGLPEEPRLNVLKKLGFVAILDALSKVGAPEAPRGRPRFVTFIQRFSSWADGERISLPHLAYALSRDCQPEFQPLKEWATDALQRWPSRGNPPSPWRIDRDPMPDEVMSRWPKGGKVLEKLVPEMFCHVHLLYSRRNSLAHDLRTGVSEASEWDYQYPYYERMKRNGRETWMLHYPVGFLSILVGTCLGKLEEWLRAQDIDPYKYYRTSEFMLEELD